MAILYYNFIIFYDQRQTKMFLFLLSTGLIFSCTGMMNYFEYLSSKILAKRLVTVSSKKNHKIEQNRNVYCPDVFTFCLFKLNRLSPYQNEKFLIDYNRTGINIDKVRHHHHPRFHHVLNHRLTPPPPFHFIM